MSEVLNIEELFGSKGNYERAFTEERLQGSC